MRIATLMAFWGAVALAGWSMASRAVAAAPIACDALGQVPLTNGTVLSAETVQAGAFTPPNAPNAAATAAFKAIPAFCRVALKLTPSTDSDIRAEVWLPVSGWNRKLQAAGNGGLGGAISYPALAAAVG